MGRKRTVSCWLVLLFVPAIARADLTPAPFNPSQLCEQAINAAAAGRPFPQGLLAAIGRVESGRRDPITGVVRPWPWTVDVEGEGYFYPSEAAAVAAVQRFQSEGKRSIDVGCLQVNLLQHPDAFTNLDAAFDPAINARYAANFLSSLHAGGTSWLQAAGLYHSATPALAAAYRQKVLAAMDDLPQPERAAPQMLAMLSPVPPFAPPAAAHVLRMRPPPPQTGMILNGRSIGGVMTGRGLAVYRAAPVRRRS